MAENPVNDAVASVLEKFGKKYLAEREEWKSFLSYIHTKCEDLLRGRIQSSVTSRVKEWDSLRGKLEKRSKEINYGDVKDVERDGETLDMVGLRVRAFFPKQLSEMYKTVEDAFDVDLERSKPFDAAYEYRDTLQVYKEHFGSYEGYHYWVKLKATDHKNLSPRLREKFKNQIVEIQVRSSMLLDGWAEVRHDILYKCLGGKPSSGERELLDTMKGVVKSMEVLLDHLLDVHEDRIKFDNTKLDTMQLLEQALVHALPQLSQSHEKIEEMKSLHPFLQALSLDTPGQFKDMIRKSKFSENFGRFQESRKVSGQQVWTFILEQIILALSDEEIKELIHKIPEDSGIHQVLCRSITWLERHLLFRVLQRPLEPDEIERCTVIWFLHEHFSAAWPEHKPKLSSFLVNLISFVKKSPVPRVDISLYIAIAEIISGKEYILPETKIMNKFQEPGLKKLLAKRQISDPLVEQLLFRYHRHDLFYDRAIISGKFGGSIGAGHSAALLETSVSQLYGAVLHRAVSHENREKNFALVKQLLETITDINVEFVNIAGQSTLHVASIFSPDVRTVEMILNTRLVDVNRIDSYGETALLVTSVLGKEDFTELLLNNATTNVNARGSLSPEVTAMVLWHARKNGSLEDFCNLDEWDQDYRNSSCSVLGCRCTFQLSRMSLAEWYASTGEWNRVESIAMHRRFQTVESFGNWNCLFAIMMRNPPQFEEIFLRRVKMDVNELDEQRQLPLGTVLRRYFAGQNINRNRSAEKLARLLLDAGADPSLPELITETPMLVYSKDPDTFQHILSRMSSTQLLAKDSLGQNVLHHVAGHGHHLPLLLARFSELNCRRYLSDLQGRTWIHHVIASAFWKSVTPCLQKCLEESPTEFKAQLKAPDNDGWAPLHWLCLACHPRGEPEEEWGKRLEFLLHSGADPDSQCNRGWTPRLILFLLRQKPLDVCSQLLGPAPDASPIESLPSTILSVFQQRYTELMQSENCSGCPVFRYSFIKYKCEECYISFCFKCGWTKEKTHPHHKFSESGMQKTKKYLDDLDREIHRAAES